ncbi:MAG: flagellar basal body rod protein FlgB [Verrucomicrobiota bacterium]
MPVAVNPLINDPTIQSLKLALDAAAMKHQAIASNIANVNTPNYKRLDLNPSFTTEFQKAMTTLESGQSMSELPKPALSETSMGGVLRMDGNNVNMEQELMDLMNNQSKFDFASKMLIQKYNNLRVAMGKG